QDPGAVKRASSQQGADESQIIRAGRIDSTPARKGLLRRSRLHRLCRKGSVGLAPMYACFSLLLARRDDEGSVLHSQGIEDVLAKIDVKRIAADEFHDAADPIDACAILPA